MKKINISVIGDGGWGTTLAIHLAKKKFSVNPSTSLRVDPERSLRHGGGGVERVKLWGPFPDYVRQVKEERYNSKFLPGVLIPQNVVLTDDLKDVLTDCDLIVFAVPSKYAYDVIRSLKATKINLSKKIFLNVTKGIDPKSFLRVSQIVQKEFPKTSYAVLSGPNIAREVAVGVPSTAVVASKQSAIANAIQQVFNSHTFRIYTNTDVVGVELGGSLKNIIALACGVCDGLGFGTNTKSAILTRGLAEMARLGKALGAKPNTFCGLSGLGDLITTSFNVQSRNRSLGEQLGKGQSLTQILAATEMAVEGVETVKAAHQLAKKHRVSMPITQEVYQILYKNKPPAQAVLDLMNREVTAE